MSRALCNSEKKVSRRLRRSFGIDWTVLDHFEQFWPTSESRIFAISWPLIPFTTIRVVLDRFWAFWTALENFGSLQNRDFSLFRGISYYKRPFRLFWTILTHNGQFWPTPESTILVISWRFIAQTTILDFSMPPMIDLDQFIPENECAVWNGRLSHSE